MGLGSLKPGINEGTFQLFLLPLAPSEAAGDVAGSSISGQGRSSYSRRN